MKHIVIVGGSFAGVSTAHRLLKQAAKTATSPFKITLVSRDSHFYWNIAAPRGLLPGQIPDEKLFRPITLGFAQYPVEKFKFVLGSATDIDVEAKRLRISDHAGKETHIDYDFLILGTGSTAQAGLPFKSLGSTEATKQALHDLQARVEKANTIAVVGGGSTGVEIAGELAFEYGREKEVILISNGPTVLEGRPAKVSDAAIKQLRKLKVHLKLDTEVVTSTPLDGHDRSELTLSSGVKFVVDLCIPALGVQPNSSYVPSPLLDDNGFVKVDEYFHVIGTDGIWAIGDVSNAEPPQLWFVDKQSKHLAKNMVLLLQGKDPLLYKTVPMGVIFVQIGKKGGTGHMGKMKLPSFIVRLAMKSLFLTSFPRIVDGSRF